MLFMRTVRDMNLSKLVADDVPLFLALLRDLFPKVTDPPKKVYENIEDGTKAGADVWNVASPTEDVWSSNARLWHADIRRVTSCQAKGRADGEGDTGRTGRPCGTGGAPARAPGGGAPREAGLSPRSKCLAEAMQGRGDARRAMEAWGAELGLDEREVRAAELIGTGSTARVFAGSWKGHQVAVKRLEADCESTNVLIRELGAMSRTRHPNVVRLVGFCFGAGTSDLVLELCRGGSLFSLLYMSDVEVVPRQQFKVAWDVAEGMAYLHGLADPVLHRDLKSLNVLLRQPVRSPTDVPLAKVADFGLAKVCARAGAPPRGGRRGPAGPAAGRRSSCGEAGAPGAGSPPEGGAYLASCGPLSGELGASASWSTRSAGTLQWMAPEVMAGRLLPRGRRVRLRHAALRAHVLRAPVRRRGARGGRAPRPRGRQARDRRGRDAGGAREADEGLLVAGFKQWRSYLVAQGRWMRSGTACSRCPGASPPVSREGAPAWCLRCARWSW
ncbi:unnamed protein product [Prorocentrum cordatum]|uniref:Protein kinase domain-containing protein n=1 Tax=Prorocentrum cordatum TaxID=2364126 RepID=A0ABN9TB28_9DINO|nr:unnamed protein product [Polarella glacialis]